MTQSQSFVIKFSSFIFLPSEVSDSKTRMGSVPLTFSPGEGTMLLSPNFFMTQSQSSFIKILKSVIKNLGWIGGINSQIIWLHPLNNLEILQVIEKLEKIY